MVGAVKASCDFSLSPLFLSILKFISKEKCRRGNDYY
jgi:hypothetical protein